MSCSISGLGKNYDRLEKSRLDKAMDDSLQIIMQSTQMGFEKNSAPDGKPWKVSPGWWADIKGHDTPLSGPMTSTIKYGPLKDAYKLKGVNARRMFNSLIKKREGEVGIVTYMASAKDRALDTQVGAKGTIEFVPINASNSPYDQTLVFNVDMIERPHLGLSTYNRIGDKTDAEWVEFYFGEQMDIELREQFDLDGVGY
jgi:hypothetical protein